MAGLFGGISNLLFGNPNKGPSMNTINRTGQQLQGMYQPYIDYGNRAMPTLEEQYAKLLNNPQDIYNSLASGYTKSPGYDFRMQEQQNALNQAMGAGGLLGTSGHQMGAMKAAEGIANQDFENYLGRLLGLYGTGLEGTQNQFNTGANFAQTLGGNMANLGNTRAQLQYTGQQNNNRMLGELGGAAMSAFSPFNMALAQMLKQQYPGGGVGFGLPGGGR